jgi:hypothetical protein
MSNALVTVSTFDTAVKARIAQNALSAAGIPSVVQDEQTVNMDWLLGPALGWIKLQVSEQDYERALAALDQAIDPESTDTVDTLPDLEQQALAESPEHPDEAVQATAQDSVPDDPPVEDRDPDVLARRFMITTLFTLFVFCPVIVFAITAFADVLAVRSRLSSQGSFHFLIGSSVLGFSLLLYLALAALLLSLGVAD